MKRPLWRRKRFWLGMFIVFLVWLTVDYFAYPYGAPMPGPAGDRGENGLWLGDDWYFGKRTDAEIAQLASDLRSQHIRYAYFHVRYIGQSGRLRYRHEQEASHLNAVLKRHAPELVSFAYLYIGNERGRTGVNLADPAIREKIVAEVRFLVTTCGFKGIHFDYEICADGDPSLLALLDETRAALPDKTPVSVATALWSPGVVRHFGYGWSQEYFAEVAKRCDQIVVMGYDSGLYLPRHYVDLMAKQVEETTRAIVASGSDCHVLIGVPTYEAGGPSHHAHAEKLSNALRGVRLGLTHLTETEKATFAGVALFAEYTTDEVEWEAYRRGWLQNAVE